MSRPDSTIIRGTHTAFIVQCVAAVVMVQDLRRNERPVRRESLSEGEGVERRDCALQEPRRRPRTLLLSISLPLPSSPDSIVEPDTPTSELLPMTLSPEKFSKLFGEDMRSFYKSSAAASARKALMREDLAIWTSAKVCAFLGAPVPPSAPP